MWVEPHGLGFRSFSRNVCSYKFLGKLTSILQKLIEQFLIYHCFYIFTTRCMAFALMSNTEMSRPITIDLLVQS